jgi:HlyD family secretion protein
MKKWIKRMVAGALLLGAIGTAFAWYFQRGDGRNTSFRTSRITRGDLLVTIDATGTLEPEEVVDVGAQVAGQILTLGIDADGRSVDYGSRVEEGMVLASIDKALAEADVKQAEAQVESAKAGVRRAEADLEQLKAKLLQARRDWERAQKLGPSEALAQATYDGYQSAYEIAKANVAVGEAAILEAKAGLSQAETTLWRANRNLGYCTITSPVKGVVIDRRVNIGQTVVASLNAPSLFLIAKDLKRMQVWVAVNEADVAKIYPGQPVTFTVDALPDETFGGEVVKVRLNASMTQNVVTYTVEIVTDNSAGRLLPYLTANVKFQVSRRENVLLVPSAALRWTPSVEQVAPEHRNGPPAGQVPTSLPQQPPAEAKTRTEARPGMIYAREGQFVRPVPVKVGLSSGTHTEVEGVGLAEGMELVTGVETGAAASTDISNPFTPKLPAPPKGGPPPR